MKKVFCFLLLLFLISCNDYKPNYQINSRRPPITIIAIDTVTKSVILRDGDNHVFTISNNTTTYAISKSLKKNDTLRLTPVKSSSVKKKF